MRNGKNIENISARAFLYTLNFAYLTEWVRFSYLNPNRGPSENV